MDCLCAGPTSIIAKEVSVTYVPLCYSTSMAYIFFTITPQIEIGFSKTSEIIYYVCYLCFE